MNINKLLKDNMKFIKFCCVGASNLCVSLCVYYILLYINVHYQIANVFGFILGSLNGYFWNGRWVFKTNKKTIGSFVRFYVTYLGTWLLSTIMLYIWVELLEISSVVAPIINVAVTTPINYVLNKRWTFNNR